jgi:RimJ/RimL family protein N-acetyltransferase
MKTPALHANESEERERTAGHVPKVEAPTRLSSDCMQTRRILLRECRPQDLPTLFTWRNADSFRFMFHYNEEIVDYDAFREEFRWDAKVRPFQYVVEKCRDRRAIGLAFVHGMSVEGRSCYLNIFLSDGSTAKGYGVDVFVLFYQFLFQHVGVERLFLEAFEYNTASVAGLRKMGLSEVGRSVNARMHNGAAHDTLRFAADSSLSKTIERFRQMTG